MTADVAGDFSAAGRVPDKCGLSKVKRFDEGRQIVGVRIHVIAVPRLVRSAMTAAVMRDDTISVLAEENHLCVPCVRIERPTVREHDRPSRTPIFEINLRSVFRSDHVHMSFSLVIAQGSWTARRA